MAKKENQYLCSDCGDTFAKWFGQCPSCGAWNTLKEFREPKIQSKGKSMTTGLDLTKADKSKKTDASKRTKTPTGISEVDRVLENGFFPGSVILFGGHPGIGKSTLAMQLFLAADEALYFSGEESVDQVESRSERLSVIPALELESSQKKNSLNTGSRIKSGMTEEEYTMTERIFSTNSLEDIVATIQAQNPKLAIIDSIQMVGSESANMGQMQSIRENAEILVKTAKSTGTTILIIGHVTKSDEIAGPKVLEHLVDVVLYLEGERDTGLRILRTSKNRFGSTMEVGVFTMEQQGLLQIENPSEFFLSERPEHASGACISVVREGSRNFLLELQALTTKTNFGLPRRTSHGMDASKLHLLLAVLSKFTAFPADTLDAYVNVVGGMRIKDPATDLALCGAFLSSRANKPIDAETVVMGEVGLSGEVRSISFLENRLQEAERLGFKKAIVPANKLPKNLPKKLEVVGIKHVGELLSLLG